MSAEHLLDDDHASLPPLLTVHALTKRFPLPNRAFAVGGRSDVQAVSDVSFEIAAGRTLGLVGESGCGKSTLGRTVLQLQRPTSGSVTFDGLELTGMSKSQLRPLRKDLQIVFQDPYASLDPRWTVQRLIAEPLHIHHRDWPRPKMLDRADQLLGLVGLDLSHRHRFAHEFSGGQRQRIGIARAIALQPRLLVLDEPVSALDVSVQAGIINLLRDLQEELGVAYLFIAHNLAVVRQVSDQIAIMYLGKIVEMGPSEEVYGRPRHPYTVALLSAVPDSHRDVTKSRERIILSGEVPSPIDPPSGCRFRTRCWKATSVCAELEPPLSSDDVPDHVFACHHPE